jgi:glycosyltransferase involved in cell wall biosynthesis
VTDEAQAPAIRKADYRLSVVAPVYNEAEGIAGFVAEVRDHLAALQSPGGHELVLVNDGSTDDSGAILDDLAAAHPGEVRVVHLARNFGHGAAVAAGLDHARGDAIILMDSDYQDDPAAFAPLVDRWQDGYDVVYVERASRQEHPVSRGAFWLFYRVLGWIADTKFPMDAGNFGLMDRRVVDQLKKLPERNRYLPGLRAWVGFRQIGIPVARRARYDRAPRVGLRGPSSCSALPASSASAFPRFSCSSCCSTGSPAAPSAPGPASSSPPPSSAGSTSSAWASSANTSRGFTMR